MLDLLNSAVQGIKMAVISIVVAVGLIAAPSNIRPEPVVEDSVAVIATTSTEQPSVPAKTNSRVIPKREVVQKLSAGTASSSKTSPKKPEAKPNPAPDATPKVPPEAPVVVPPAPIVVPKEEEIDLESLAPMSNATIDVQTYTIAKPTLSGIGNKHPADKKGYVTLVILDSAKKEVFRDRYSELVRNNWYSIVTTPLKAGFYTAELYDAKDQKLLASERFAVNFAVNDEEKLTDTSGTGVYEVHTGQGYSKTESIGYDAALSNCQLNAANNPTRGVKCYWKGKLIYGQAGAVAAIDQTTLTTSSQHPTFTGTASGLSVFGLRIYSKNTKCGGCHLYGENEKPLSVPVTNGRWTFSATEKPLPPGRYALSLTYMDGETLMGLTSGTIVITE